MIIIADSGSTKTEWYTSEVIDGKQHFFTLGFNPYFQSSEDILLEIQKEISLLLNYVSHKKTELFFYGAGCSTNDKKAIIHKALQQAFPNASIHIEHDLLASARAVCGNQEGIAAILGTGSNSCYYNGVEILQNIPSLGFMLGDEGSGAYIGKKFITAYLYKTLPTELALKFNETYNLSTENILDGIYKKPMPSRFLASFNTFVADNITHPYMHQLVRESFIHFFDVHICKYPQHTNLAMGCVGSLGYYYQSILKEVAAQKKVQLGLIIQSPMQGLILYHQ